MRTAAECLVWPVEPTFGIPISFKEIGMPKVGSTGQTRHSAAVRMPAVRGRPATRAVPQIAVHAIADVSAWEWNTHSSHCGAPDLATFVSENFYWFSSAFIRTPE